MLPRLNRLLNFKLIDALKFINLRDILLYPFFETSLLLSHFVYIFFCIYQDVVPVLNRLSVLFELLFESLHQQFTIADVGVNVYQKFL